MVGDIVGNVGHTRQNEIWRFGNLSSWRCTQMECPAVNKSYMFEDSSLCLALYIIMTISCNRMLYGEKLARLNKSSYARFHSQ